MSGTPPELIAELHAAVRAHPLLRFVAWMQSSDRKQLQQRIKAQRRELRRLNHAQRRHNAEMMATARTAARAFSALQEARSLRAPEPTP